jgi:hypothetical protein
MLDEARKREKVANAFLAATMALSAAQSPKDFVKTGKIESPGVALMQRWGRVRREAERNLDSGAVVPRNKKMKTFKEFVEEAYILEVNRPESGSPEEQARWDRQNARRIALNNPSSKIIGIIGRDKNGIQRYGLKDAARRRQQQKNRASRLAYIDSDLDPEQNKRGNKKIKLIKTKGTYKDEDGRERTGRGKEAHHLTSISQSYEELKGLSPEERKVKKDNDAKGGKFHGSDPRNIAQTDGPEGGTGIRHRGEGGYHSRQKPVGTGGSIQNIGSVTQIVAARRRVKRQGSASERLAREKGIETPKMQRERELRARMSVAAKARGFD